MKRLFKIGIVTCTIGLALGLAATEATSASAQASPHRAVATASVVQPSITSVSFYGTGGPGATTAPYIVITGSGFGNTPPPGTPNNQPSGCGATYSDNGDLYGNLLYFIDDNNFEAGYNGPGGGNCMGIKSLYWSNSVLELQLGNAYNRYGHWYLTNGDGYALSIDNGIFGGTVSNLN